MTGSRQWTAGSGVLGRALLVAAAAAYAVPLLAIGRLALNDDPQLSLTPTILLRGWSTDAARTALADPDVLSAARTSVLVAVAAIAVNLVLLAPLAVVTVVRAPRLRPVVTALTLVPWIAPPVALVVGVTTFDATAPWFLTSAFSLVPFYALWAMPFTYRVLDAGLRQVGARTLYEAARTLGASPLGAVRRVLLPSMRPALLAAAGLTAATVLGEYAFAAMLVEPTLATTLLDGPAGGPQGGMLLALLVILLAGLSLATLVAGGVRRRGGRVDQPLAKGPGR